MALNGDNDPRRRVAKSVIDDMFEYLPRLDGVDGRIVDAVLDRAIDTINPFKDDRFNSALFDRISVELSNMTLLHPDNGIMGGRLSMADLYLKTPGTFHQAMERLYKQNTLNQVTWESCCKLRKEIKELIEGTCDGDFESFPSRRSVLHLKKSYLLRDQLSGDILERPAYLCMRVAVGLWQDDMRRIRETYELIKSGTVTHASPIMFNMGTTKQQLASCFIQSIQCDTAEEKYKGLAECAKILEHNGGAGMNLNGDDTELFHVILDRLTKDIPQGGRKNAKRPGAAAVYREPWETDFLAILANKKPDGEGLEENKNKDIFPAMWTPDLFVKRLEESISDPEGVWWSFFDGDVAKQLRNSHGEEFERIYLKAEAEELYQSRMLIQDVMTKVCECFKETGTPYVLFKDTINAKCNQNNRGTIRGSNLCGEIHLYSSADETGVCILASIRVSDFLIYADSGSIMYDFDALAHAAKVLTRNLNRAIDLNYYPSEKSAKSCLDNRPIGIGVRDVQGLLFECKLPYTSARAQELMEAVMETIYFAALSESNELAAVQGAYKHFAGSMYSKGIFHQDLHIRPDVICTYCQRDKKRCPYCAIELLGLRNHDWVGLREKVCTIGLANSLVTTLMPTVGTAQVYSDMESFDPVASLAYVSNVNSGEFQVSCRALVKDLEEIGMWNKGMSAAIVKNGGSIRGIEGVPQWIQDVYSTIWEVPQMARMRFIALLCQYVDQGVSMNIHLMNPNKSKYLTLLLYAHKLRLPTGNYYHRSQAAVDANRISFGSSLESDPEESNEEQTGQGSVVDTASHPFRRPVNGEICEACSA